jgi:hypothetical protein
MVQSVVRAIDGTECFSETEGLRVDKRAIEGAEGYRGGRGL